MEPSEYLRQASSPRATALDDPASGQQYGSAFGPAAFAQLQNNGVILRGLVRCFSDIALDIRKIRTRTRQFGYHSGQLFNLRAILFRFRRRLQGMTNHRHGAESSLAPIALAQRFSRIMYDRLETASARAALRLIGGRSNGGNSLGSTCHVAPLLINRCDALKTSRSS
jgi:hypothetical protein